MYPISNAVKALFESEQRQILRITGTDKNGTAINITDADVVIDSFNIDRYSCNGEKLEIGTAIAAEMTLKLDNHDGSFNGVVFEGTELFVEIGIADWTQDDPTVTWIPCGYFTPDEQPRSLNIITIHALDRMMKFDATMPTLTPWVTKGGEYVTDSQGNIIYFVSNVQFPVTVQNLVKRVAMLCGVPFTQSLTSLPNYSYTISALPTLQQEITFRNLIQWCAGIMGANAWIDWTGSLRFSWYGATTGYTSTTANRFSSDLHEDNITITGVQYTNTQNVTIVSGSADYALDMTGNYLAAAGIAEILPNVKNVINGFAYRPFTASVINAPYLWPMDMITFAKDGVNYTCALTNVNFGINGTTELQSKGETAQSNSGTKPSGATNEQAFLIEQAAEATRTLDKSLDQEGIFNRLTDNGETQGLILYNGKVYLNAEYIQAGTIAANLLMAAILTIGGANNGNGQIKILDANGNVIGTWDKNGISVTKGSITGGTINGATLTLGGNNNASGTLTVKDASNNTVGTWGKGGINIFYGALSISYIRQYYDDTYYFDQNGFVAKRVENKGLSTERTSTISISGKAIDINTQSSGATISEININSTHGDNLYEMEISPYEGIDWKVEGNRFIYVTPHSTGVGNGVILFTDFIVASGNTKSKIVSTDQYSDRLLYCYETPSPLYGDVGEGVIGDDGLCYVTIDPIFAQTITTDNYQVFLQRYGAGECYVQKRKGGWFVVAGTPGLAFGWEIKGKQADIANIDLRRLDRNDEPFTVPTQTYGEDAAKHIEDIRKERESA